MQVSFDPRDKTQVAAIFAMFANKALAPQTARAEVESEELAVTTAEVAQPEKRGRGRPPKAKEEPVAAEGDGFDFGETAPAVTQTTPKEIDLDRDLIPAFQAFAGQRSRDEAAKVLQSYGVKSVRDLPKAKYPEVMKRLQPN